MFMVMLISVTRTILIFTPFFQINRKGVIAACVAFEIFWMVTDTIFLGSGRLQVMYHYRASCCGVMRSDGTQTWTWDVYVMFFFLWQVLGTLVVLISFVLSLREFAVRRRSTIKSAKTKSLRPVSVTITLFTAIFLLCNLPVLVLQTSTNFSNILGVQPPFNTAFNWYALLVSHVVLTTFNAAANPYLYLTRMKKYRRWLLNNSLSRKRNQLTRQSIQDGERVPPPLLQACQTKVTFLLRRDKSRSSLKLK
jgi:hypothetical protein